MRPPVKFSPYNYNLPVDERMFFGRTADLATLSDGLLTPKGSSFALVGGRRMGKTSLLYALKRHLESERSTEMRIIPVFIDVSGATIESAHDFFTTLLAELELPLLDQLQGVTLDLDLFANNPQKSPSTLLRNLLQVWNRASMAQDGQTLRLVILLDECEQIVDQAWTASLYSHLRVLIGHHTTESLFKLVLAGSHRFLSQVQQKGSQLRNILNYHYLLSFYSLDTIQLIT